MTTFSGRWCRTNCPPPTFACGGECPELSLDLPARVKPGKPFAAQVFQYSDKGFTKPAAA